MAASVGSIPVSQAFRTMSKRNLPISDIGRELNMLMKKFLPDTMFFAATLGEISPLRNRIEVWCGGLPDAYIITVGSEIRRTLSSSYMPLGILEDHEFESAPEVISLEPEDRLIFLTDGVTECVNAAGEMFGEDKLLQVLSEANSGLSDAIVQAVYSFNADPELQDDISLVEIRCSETGSAKEFEEPLPASEMQTSAATKLPELLVRFEWGSGLITVFP